MVEYQPPGFRFYPTEEELVSFYLHNKLRGHRQDLNRLMDRIIPVVNIYHYNPWELPKFSQQLCHRDPEQWFFFIPRKESEGRGGRHNRLTTEGYWKATGSPGSVYSSNNSPIGEKRTMVFYMGRAPNGSKTEWKMNEYKAIDQGDASTSSTATTPVVRQEFSLCRVYKKSKYFRVFDRRPPQGMIINEPITPQLPHHKATALFDHQSIQMAAAQRINSPETSSSGDDGCSQHPQIEESINNTAEMTSNNEPWWDWDQVDNWFFN